MSINLYGKLRIKGVTTGGNGPSFSSPFTNITLGNFNRATFSTKKGTIHAAYRNITVDFDPTFFSMYTSYDSNTFDIVQLVEDIAGPFTINGVNYSTFFRITEESISTTIPAPTPPFFFDSNPKNLALNGGGSSYATSFNGAWVSGSNYKLCVFDVNTNTPIANGLSTQTFTGSQLLGPV